MKDLRPDAKIVDLHMHLSQTGTQTWVQDVYDVEHTRRYCGLEAINVVNIVMWYTMNLPRNPVSLLLKLRNPGKIYSFGGIRFPSPERSDKKFGYADEAKRIIPMGFDGVKLYMKPTVRKEFGERIDSPVYDDMFAYYEKEQVPILYHIADPYDWWEKDTVDQWIFQRGWFFGDGTYPSFKAFHEETEGLLKKFPKLRVTFPHFFFTAHDLDYCDSLLDRWENVRIDITPGAELYFALAQDPKRSRDFFIRRADRILFGTDNVGSNYKNPWNVPERCESRINNIRCFLEHDHGKVHGREIDCLALPVEVQNKIYSENFYKFVSPKPKAVNAAEALAYTKDIYDIARAKQDCPPAVEVLDEVRRHLEELQ